eukprot:9852195-Alexandrium_andersonii.AAC.1
MHKVRVRSHTNAIAARARAEGCPMCLRFFHTEACAKAHSSVLTQAQGAVLGAHAASPHDVVCKVHA